MNEYRYVTDVDGRNDVRRVDLVIQAESENAAWSMSHHLMNQMAIAARDRVNPTVTRIKRKDV